MTKAEKELIDIDTVFTALAHPSRREVLMVLKLRDGAMIAGNRGSVFMQVADHNETSSFPTKKRG